VRYLAQLPFLLNATRFAATLLQRGEFADAFPTEASFILHMALEHSYDEHSNYLALVDDDEWEALLPLSAAWLSIAGEAIYSHCASDDEINGWGTWGGTAVGRVEEAAREIFEERRLQRRVPGPCGPDPNKEDKDRGRTSWLSRAQFVCSSANSFLVSAWMSGMMLLFRRKGVHFRHQAEHFLDLLSIDKWI
jgi:hypothetical protein